MVLHELLHDAGGVGDADGEGDAALDGDGEGETFPDGLGDGEAPDDVRTKARRVQELARSGALTGDGVGSRLGRIPSGFSTAAGSLVGAFGATDSFLNWNSLIAVKTATPAKTNVASKIIIATTLFLKIFFIY